MEILKIINAMKLLYFSLVRSHQEFGSIYQSVKYDRQNQIKIVQYKFLKLFCSKSNMSVETLLVCKFPNWALH